MVKYFIKTTGSKQRSLTMIYYAFNNNKPLPPSNAKIFVIHYCQHCNTELIGEWAQKDYSPCNPSMQKEFLEYVALNKCPICSGKLSKGFEHHFTNCRVRFTYDHLLKFEKNFEPQIEYEGPCKGMLRVAPDGWVKQADFNVSVHELKKGDKVITKYGPCTFRMILCDNDMRAEFHNNTIESILSFLTHFRLKLREQTVENKTQKLIDKYISKNENVSSTTIEIKKDFDLKRYLEQILLIEKNIFSITERLKELYYLDYFFEKEAVASEKLLFLKNKNNVDKALENYKALKSRKIDKEITIDDFSIDYPEEPKKPKKPKAPVLAKPGFFNKKRVLAENALLTEEYEKALEKYNRANEKYKADLKRRKETIASLEVQREERYKSAIENAKESLEKEIVEAEEKYEDLLKKYREEEITAKDIPTPEKAKHHLLKDEIKTAEELLKKFYKAQSQMYSYGILFEKYRNFVAVSSFYEYIASGRCETLEGPNGAYNLFENEIRMNMVICQLNQVLESLEQIKQNQYMIYSAIQETNAQLTSLNYSMNKAVGALESIKANTNDIKSNMSKIAENIEVIAYNTEQTAFYAKKNVELTNALGFMVALK